jgi:SAM-dependent methyltransferase
MKFFLIILKNLIDLLTRKLVNFFYNLKTVPETKFKKRAYPSYKFYLFHQKIKTFIRSGKLRASYNRALSDFEDEFKNINFLNIQNILCVAARMGTEVHTLRNLKYNAIGIDIYYPKSSKYVHYGEFEDIPYYDHSFDAIYTNSIDHLYSLKKSIIEFNRVLKINGFLIIRLQKGFDEISTNLFRDYESFAWSKKEDIFNEILKIGHYNLIKTFPMSLNSLYVLQKKN